MTAIHCLSGTCPCIESERRFWDQGVRPHTETWTWLGLLEAQDLGLSPLPCKVQRVVTGQLCSFTAPTDCGLPLPPDILGTLPLSWACAPTLAWAPANNLWRTQASFFRGLSWTWLSHLYEVLSALGSYVPQWSSGVFMETPQWAAAGFRVSHSIVGDSWGIEKILLSFLHPLPWFPFQYLLECCLVHQNHSMNVYEWTMKP